MQIFFGQVISPRHSDQMSQRSQVCGITLQACEDSDCQFGQTDRPSKGQGVLLSCCGQLMKAELHLRWEQESGQDRGEAVTCLSIGTKVNVAMLPIVTPRSYRILSWEKFSSGMLLIAIFTRPSYFGKKFSVPCCQLTVYISRPTLKTLPAFFHMSSFFW